MTANPSELETDRGHVASPSARLDRGRCQTLARALESDDPRSKEPELAGKPVRGMTREKSALGARSGNGRAGPAPGGGVVEPLSSGRSARSRRRGPERGTTGLVDDAINPPPGKRQPATRENIGAHSANWLKTLL